VSDVSAVDVPDQPQGDQHYIAPWIEESAIPSSRLAKLPRDVSLGFAIACATDLLYTLSGSQFRWGRSVVRPTALNSGWQFQNQLYPYSSMSGYGSAWGFAAGWAWTAIGMGWWQYGQDSSECVLQGIVRKINQVMVDGVVLDPSLYTVYDDRRLVRLIDPTGQSSGAWPWEQNLGLPLTQSGTWAVDYEWGTHPPPSGEMACAELTIELAKAFGGDDETRFNPRVLQVTTEGISMQTANALQYIQQRLSGLPLVDIFLKSYNPDGNRRQQSAFLAPNSTMNREMSDSLISGSGFGLA
jgi:hypothetical protein